MSRRALREGAGRLRPPPRRGPVPAAAAHYATLYRLAHVPRSSLARLATAGWHRAAYTPGAPRPAPPSQARAGSTPESCARPNPDRLVEGTT